MSAEPTGAGSAVNAKHGEWLRRAETAETRVADAECVLRELHDNSSGQIEDPHFRHWAAVTIASYFSAQSAVQEKGDEAK